MPNPEENNERRITLRAICIAFACVLGITVAGCISAFLRYDLIGTGHLPRCALYPILVLMLLNYLLRRFTRYNGLKKHELLFIYCTILIMTGIPGQQFATYLYFGMVGPIYYATPQNQYAELFHKYIPEWLVPSKDPDSPAIKWLFEPPEDLGFMDIPWGAWVRPLAVWIPFCLVIFLVTLAIAALLRKQWSDNERLLFPLARVPMDIVEMGQRKENSLFRNRIMWIFCLIPIVVYLVNGLHHYFPSVPLINMRPNTRALFPDRPWTVFNWIELNIYFGMIGISYILTTEMGFSLWFFWLAQRFQMFSRIMVGAPEAWGIFGLQAIGAIISLGLVYIWSGRVHLRQVVRKAVFDDPSIDDSKEPISYRASVIIIVGGFVFLLTWFVLIGLSPIWAFLMLVFYFLTITVLTRVVSEAGTFVWWAPLYPQFFPIRFFGTALVGSGNMTLLMMTGWNLHDTATCVLPQALNGFKIAEEAGLNRRKVFIAMCCALLISVLACNIPCIYSMYRYGIPNLGWWSRGAPRALADTISGTLRSKSQLFQPWEFGHIAGGGLFTLFLVVMRRHFIWWPFHPLGYVASWCMGRYWFAILIGWSLKVIVTRIGGIRLWKKYYPAALGLVIGETLILFTWLLFHFLKPIHGVLIIE